MIPNQWYAILESSEVQAGRPVGVTRMGEQMVLWRDGQGRVACAIDLCPHRGVALSAGKVTGDCVECPFHGFRYDPSGRCTLVPANGRNAPAPAALHVKTFPTCEAHGFIWIWWGESRDPLPPVRYFDSIDDTFTWSTLRDHWAAHYSRAIENQLDVVHLPFVHHNTIGRGNRALVDGPLVRWAAREPNYNLLNLWVYNRVDDGAPPKKPAQIPEPSRRPYLQFLFPNVWHNWISDDMRVTVAFAPIDNDNTLMYVRWYQRIVRWPVARHIFNWLGALGNLVVERQDRRVVQTQRPKASSLRMGEKLIQGDLPIIEYRRRREELIAAAR